MKNLIFTVLIMFCVSIGFTQEKKEKMLLGLFSSHLENPENIYGKVKEIHYQPFHCTDENGKVVKGQPIKLSESSNVTLWQPWSYFHNELGQMVKMSLKDDQGCMWIGAVHHANNRIENIYWLRDDTLMVCWDYDYLKNGNIERKWRMIQNNEVAGKTIYELDKKGFMMKFIGQDKEGKAVWTTEYTRNPNGTLKTYKGINGEGKILFDYDNYKYNDNGLFETMHFNLLSGEKVIDQPEGKTEYEYDELGNWTKSTSGERMIERKIVYYQ